MISLLKQLWNDRSGNALVITAAAMPLLIGAAGLATDTIQWTLWKRQLQRAADSAAIAGVYTGVQSYTQADVEAAVDTDLAKNNHTLAAMHGTRVVVLPGDDTANGFEDQVQVTIQARQALTFSSLFLTSTPIIRATATAASIGGGDVFCALATDTSATAVGIEVAGAATVDMGDCSLMANPSNQTQAAMNGGNGSSVTAHSLAAVGGVQYSSQWNVDSYDPYSTAIADPFINLDVPTTCTKTFNPSNNQNGNQFGGTTGSINRATGVGTSGAAGSIIGGTTTDSANDVVCINSSSQGQGFKGVSIGSGQNVTLGPATYVINGGDLSMTGGSLSCNGCTIILTGPTAATIGNVKITGGALSLAAPASGPYQSIALMQDRDAIDSHPTNPPNDLVGNNGASVQGAIYFPSQALNYSGGSSTVAACVQIVSKRVKFSGSSVITKTDLPACAAYGMTSIGTGATTARKIRLVA